MTDWPSAKLLRALNGMAVSYYLNSTVATTFSTAAYLVETISTAAKIKAITNAWMMNDSAITSADTLPAGTQLRGKITAITMVSGRAVAYCAPAYVFNK
jgi:hypothetical protein